MAPDLALDDVLEVLENVRQTSETTWVACCPAHDDQSPSLSLRLLDDGNYLVYCFRGCALEAIMSALGDKLGIASDGPIVRIVGFNPSTTPKTGPSMWMDLFEFLPDELDPFFVGGIDRHLRISDAGIEFLWPSYPSALKTRPVEGNVKFFWAKSSLKPPLWPEVEDKLNEEIYLTEGESDCIVLRRCGLHAFAITMGGQAISTQKPRFSSAILRELVNRGAKRIYLAFDDDDVGHNTASIVHGQMIDLERTMDLLDFDGIRILPIVEMTHPLGGEKDLRQVWLRLRDTDEFSNEIQRIKSLVDLSGSSLNRFVDARDFLSKEIQPMTWLVDDIITEKGIGWISGYPKMGKSYVALDLATALATGSRFLNYFSVSRPTDVLYVVKENSDQSIQHRLQKILSSRPSMDISVFRKGEAIFSVAPGRLMLDLSREFRFEPSQVESLIREVLLYAKLSGRNIGLIIIDPLSFSLPHGKFDINAFTDVQAKVIDPISHIVRKTGASVMVVHHQSKSANNSMLGSVAYEASFDDRIAFVTKAMSLDDYVPGDPVRMQISHRDGTEQVMDVELHITEDGYDPVVSPIDMGDVRKAPSIKISYIDRQREASVKILDMLPDVEFSWRDALSLFESSGMEGVSRSLFENTFTWMYRTGGLLEIVRRGVYKKSVRSTPED